MCALNIEGEVMKINKNMEKWWDANEKQFMADSCHMSEFHMAGVVWKAAIELEREACAKVCEARADPVQEFNGLHRAAIAIRKRSDL